MRQSRKLIPKPSIIRDIPHLENNNQSWQIKVFTLGRFSVLIYGKPLNFNGQAQHKPLELLKALITLGGRDVSKYKLADTLYPEAEGDKSMRSMVTTLHRLRELINNNDAIQFQGHRLTLNPEYFWVDIWILERLLGKIDISLIESYIDNNEILYLTNKVLQLYRGPFLREEVNNSLAFSFRKSISYKFLRKLSLLGQLLEKRGLIDMAIDVYLRALEEDELAEKFYQRLMICYQKQGFRGEAMSVYKRCCRTLNTILGIDPSGETKAIRTQFLN